MEDLTKFTATHRRLLVDGARQISAIGDKLAGVLSDIDRKQDLDSGSKARLKQAARTAAREQLAQVRRQHEAAVKESVGILRRARRADSWIPATEGAIASHAAHLVPLLQSRARDGSIEQAVRDTLTELHDDGNGQAILALRRIAPSLARAAGRPLADATLRDLDTLAAIHVPAAADIAKATAYESELLGPTGAKNLETAYRLMDSHLAGPDAVGDARASAELHVLPQFGTKEPLMRAGATRDSAGNVVLPQRQPEPNREAAGQAEQVAQYRMAFFDGGREEA